MIRGTCCCNKRSNRRFTVITRPVTCHRVVGFAGFTMIRRMMKNCSETVPQSERDGIVNDYIDRLMVSGYENQVREIVESGLLGYEGKLERARKSNIPLHRPALMSLASRQKKILTQKISWYKSKPKNQPSPKKKK